MAAGRHHRAASFAEKGLALRADVPARLPRVQADPDRAIQVLSNALRYTPAPAWSTMGGLGGFGGFGMLVRFWCGWALSSCWSGARAGGVLLTHLGLGPGLHGFASAFGETHWVGRVAAFAAIALGLLALQEAIVPEWGIHLTVPDRMHDWLHRLTGRATLPAVLTAGVLVGQDVDCARRPRATARATPKGGPRLPQRGLSNEPTARHPSAQVRCAVTFRQRQPEESRW